MFCTGLLFTRLPALLKVRITCFNAALHLKTVRPCNAVAVSDTTVAGLCCIAATQKIFAQHNCAAWRVKCGGTI